MDRFNSSTISRITGRMVAGFIAIAMLSGIAAAGELRDSFATDPSTGGWIVAGDPSLFSWNPGVQAVDATWDSSRPNSFFYRPLGTVLSKADDFQITFSLRMHQLQLGTTAGKPAEFPIAVGLINRRSITNANSYRGAGVSSLYGMRNILEWNFFPDAGFGDTWATTVISSNNVFAFGHTFPLPLAVSDLYRVTLSYSASNQVLRTSAERNGTSVGLLESISLGGTPDFRVDAFSITSYSDAVQTGPPAYHGSILARGSIEDVTLTVPDGPVSGFALMISNGTTFADFVGRSNWVHTVERSTNLRDWSPISAPVPGSGARIILQDTNAPGIHVFYRIRSERP